MDYHGTLKKFAGSGTVGALRDYLLARPWTEKGPPTLYIIADPDVAQAAAVRGDYDAAKHLITVRHSKTAADKDILDTILFEVGNASNPKIAEAAGLGQREPILNVGAARGASEYDSLKRYVVALVAVFGKGSVAALPNLADQTPDLPAQAKRTLKTWVDEFQPICASFGVQPPDAFKIVPLKRLLPLPASVPAPASPPSSPDVVSAEQAAVLRFCSTVHNPDADQTGEWFYLARLTTIQVYAYERPRAWNQLQLTVYLENMPDLAAKVGDFIQHEVYKPYRAVWADLDKRYRCYVFAWLMADFENAYPQCVPPEYVFDTGMIAAARSECARGIAARYGSGDMTAVRPVKGWLAGDEDLLKLANKYLDVSQPRKRIDLSAIK